MKHTFLVIVALVFFIAVGGPIALGQARKQGRSSHRSRPIISTRPPSRNGSMASRSRCPNATVRDMSSGPPARSPNGTAYSSATRRSPGRAISASASRPPITVGSVLVRAGGQVSMLRPTAPYPGDLADESQWMPAEHVARPPAADPKTADEQYVLWVFPKAARDAGACVSRTRPGRSIAASRVGWAGPTCSRQRMANVAPAATAVTDANGEAAARINDESNNGMWGAWDNGPEGGPQPVSPQHPVDVLLAWRQPVAIRALGALWAGFAAAEVQSFEGPADRLPREAAESDWRTVAHWEGLENQYPRGLGVNWLDLGQTLTTRAIRLRITQATKESHPHLAGKDQGRPTRLARRVARPAPAGRCAAGSVLSSAAAARRRTARADSRAIHARCAGLCDVGDRIGRWSPRTEPGERDAVSRRIQHRMVGRHRRPGPRC